jgi:PilZ domain
MFKLVAVFAYVGLGFLLLTLYRREKQKPAQQYDDVPLEERPTPEADDASGPKSERRPKPKSERHPKPKPAAADTMPADERRTEPRWLTRRVSVMISDADTRKLLTRATLYDRSVTGMRLVAERNLDTGARLFICPATPGSGKESAKVEVRYCQRSDDGWLLGCKFTEPLSEEASARFG